MKNLFLGAMLIGTTAFFGSKAKADAGMPRTFSVLTSVSGPMVTGQLGEIQLSQFKLSKDQVCGEVAEFDYSGPALHLTVGGEDYIMESNVTAALSFATATCDLNMTNVTEVLLIFKHTKIDVGVALDIDLEHQRVQISSRDLSSAFGNITSKY